MAGNGDERQAAAWERVEAKLDRVAETVDRLSVRVEGLEGTVSRHGESLARLERLAESAERRLTRLETDVGVAKLLIEAVRHETDVKLDRLKDELLTGLGREMRIELLAAQSLNDDRLSKLERRVDAIEAAKV